MLVFRISTERLDVVCATLEHLSAELHAPEHLAGLLGAEVPMGWPPGQYDRDALEYFHGRLLEDGETNPGWYSWYAMTKTQPATVIAAGGYIGPPNAAGEVEIGFSVMPQWRRQGYAAELARALTARASADPRVRTIVAHAAPSNTGSRSVLLRSGFAETAQTNDDGDTRFEWRESSCTAS